MKRLILLALATSNLMYANPVMQQMDDMLAQRQGNGCSPTACSAGKSTITDTQTSTSPISLAYLDTKPSNSNDPLSKLTKKYAFVLLYESTCPHCQKFTPILKKYAKDKGFKVYPFTTDGKDLPAFPNSLKGTQKVVDSFTAGQNWSYPALYLVNLDTLKSYPLSYGEKSYSQLNMIMNKFVNDNIIGAYETAAQNPNMRGSV